MSVTWICWILGAALIASLFVMVCWGMWFFAQWRKLEAILEKFQKDGGYSLKDTIDIQETRESKLVSEMQQILSRAAWKERQIRRENNQIMELISDLSHQLKTPLANIILDTELLESEELQEDQKKEFIRHAKNQASRMQWLMQNLLKASRLENGIIQFQAENTSIKTTIAKAVGAVYAQASSKNIEICVEVFEDFKLYHNPKWTAEAMMNVLENAVKYSPEGSRIEVSILKMDIYTRIAIRDEGIGIPETEFNQIFQRFYRGKRSDTEEGTGLGLYLAQLILQSEQGYMTVSSKVRQGSCFYLFLLNNQG